MRHHGRQHIWAAGTRELPIIPAALGPNAGLIGAAIAMPPKPPTG